MVDDPPGAAGKGVVRMELQMRFCHVCGHPLTEEAWAELEKRLGGEGVLKPIDDMHHFSAKEE